SLMGAAICCSALCVCRSAAADFSSASSHFVSACSSGGALSENQLYHLSASSSALWTVPSPFSLPAAAQLRPSLETLSSHELSRRGEGEAITKPSARPHAR